MGNYAHRLQVNVWQSLVNAEMQKNKKTKKHTQKYAWKCIIFVGIRPYCIFNPKLFVYHSWYFTLDSHGMVAIQR